MKAFDLNLRHLFALDAIERLGTLNAAAAAVHMSQPALTQAVGKLEHQLEVSLFERRSDGVKSTFAGQALAQRSRLAIDHLGRAARDALRGGARPFARPERMMTATQLRALLAVADEGSFVGAAGATGLSQPALHRAVRDLEQLGGAALVERRGRGIALTPAGRRMARGARLAAAEIAAGLAEVANGRPGDHPVVVGTMPLARARVLPAALAAFVGERPGSAVRVVEGSWRELVEPLRDGVLDLMVGAMRAEVAADLVQQPLFADELVVVGRAGHPLASLEPGTAALARFGWIVPPAGAPLRAQWEVLFAGSPLPEAPIECGSTMVIRGVLVASDLLSLLSPDQVAIEIASGMLSVLASPLPTGHRTIGIVTRAGWLPTPEQSRLIAALRRASGGLHENL